MVLTHFISGSLLEDERPIKCMRCNNFYKNHKTLRTHVLLDCLSQKQHKCSECIYSTKRKANLMRHIILRHR